MSEKLQQKILIGIGILLCIFIVLFTAFNTTPIQIIDLPMSSSVVSMDESQKININEASIKELQELPGIGPETAKKIVEYREEKGKFLVIEDILDVSGIGEKKMEELEPFIRFR